MHGLMEKLGKSFGSSRSGSESIPVLDDNNNQESAATLIVPELLPSPAEDCQRLYKAFKGLGTDEKELIRVLGHRNACQRKKIRDTYQQLYNQRKKIRDTYQQLYNESLLDALHSELSGDFRNAIILWTTDPPERDAKLAKDALKMCKKGVKYLKIIIEIACTTSPDHLMAVRQAYCALFGCSVEEDIALHVSSPPLRKLLLGLVSSYRYNGEVTDLVVANAEATNLNEAIKTKHLDQNHVVWILCTRNFYQLRATFECYVKNFGNAIDKDINSSGKGDLQSLLIAVISCIELPEKHFAAVIKGSVAGLGTDEDSLTRVIVTRAEIDMVRIKEQYRLLYKASLDADVIDDTSGDYRDFLMTLLGKGI